MADIRGAEQWKESRAFLQGKGFALLPQDSAVR